MARTVSRPGSPGPLPTNATHPRVDGGGEVRVDWLRVMRLAFRSRSPAARAVRPSAVQPPRRACALARRSPTPAASAGSPVADIRTASSPSGESATARTQSSSSVRRPRPPRPGLRPVPRSRPRGWRARRARRSPRPACAGRRGRPAVGRQVVVGTRLDRQRALAGGRQHLQRVEHLGRLVEPAEPGQAGAGQHHGVVRTVADLADAGVDVAADVDDLDAEPEGVQLGRPPR